jgi:hypothetical protein
MRITRARAAAISASRRRRLTRLLLVLAIACASRTAPAWAQSNATVYGRLYTTGTVFSTTLSSASTPTTTSATLSPADASHFSVGQLAEVWLDCATLRALPADTPNAGLCSVTATSAPVQVVIDSLDPVSGAVTFYGNSFDLPAAPLSGARFDSVLYGPGNLSVDASGRTYVVDSWNSRIAVFDAGGTPLYTIGHYGSVYTVDNDTTDANGDGAPDDPLYGYPVAPADPHAVCWDALGHANAPDAGECPNDPTQLLGLFEYPNDIAVASDGTLIVADSGNHRIQILKPDPAGSIVASDGTTRFTASTLGTWGLGIGAEAGTMSFPGGVATGANGRIAVADTDNSRIQVFDPSSDGTLSASDGTTYTTFVFGSQGESETQFFYPLDVATDPSGLILVADSGNNQIKVFSSTGSHLTTLGDVDGGLDPGQFGYPWGVASDASGNILVADTFGQRIQVLTHTSSGYTADSAIQLPTILSPVGVASVPGGGFMVTEFGTHQITRLVAAELTVQDPVTVSTTRTTSGAEVQVSFTVENTGAVPLTGVQPQLTGATTIACSSGNGSAATDVDVNATATFTFCFAAGDPNTAMNVQVSATGWAGETMVASASKRAPEITVLPAGVGIGITATASSTRVLVNHTVTVNVTLKNTGLIDLSGVQLALGSVPGLALNTASSDSLTRPTLAAGASQALTLTFDATAAQSLQPLSLTVTANETNPDTGAPAEATASVSIEVVTDADPPVITAQVRGPLGEAPNAYGWIQYGPAYVTITATDSGVGLRSIAYKAISLQSGSQAFNGESAGSIVSTGFFSRGKGSTLIAFWAEDMAGSAAAAGLVPADGESVTDFCTRVVAQCVTINIDPLTPFLDHWPAQISDDNTSATIPFDAIDAQSGVATIALASSTEDASLILPSSSNPQPSLVLTAQGAAVSADVTVTDYAGLQSTFRLPFAGPGKPLLRMDATPPEILTHVDPGALGRRCSSTAPDGSSLSYWCTSAVYGTDNLPGLTTNAFAPVSVGRVQWGGPDHDDDDRASDGWDADHASDHGHDNDDRGHDDSRFDGAAEVQTYSFTDEYTAEPTFPRIPNRVTLVEKVRQDGDEARVRVVSYQYTVGTHAGAVISPDWAYETYQWSRNRDGSLKTLNQKFELHKGRDRRRVVARYDAKKDLTVVQELGPDPERRVIYAGLVLLRMTTHSGDLQIDYDGTPYTGRADDVDDSADDNGHGNGNGHGNDGDDQAGNGDHGHGHDAAPDGPGNSDHNDGSASDDSSHGNSNHASNDSSTHHDDEPSFFGPVSAIASPGSSPAPNGGSAGSAGSGISGAAAPGSGNAGSDANDNPNAGNGNANGSNGNANPGGNGNGNGASNGSENGNGSSSATEARDASGNAPRGNADASADNVPASSDTSDGNGKKSNEDDEKDTEDRVPPVLTLPGPISTVATSLAGAVVTYSTSAVDAVSGSRSVSCAVPSGSLFSVGTTSVFCSALDAAGNVASGTFSVTVTPGDTSSPGRGNGTGNNGNGGSKQPD